MHVRIRITQGKSRMHARRTHVAHPTPQRGGLGGRHPHVNGANRHGVPYAHHTACLRQTLLAALLHRACGRKVVGQVDQGGGAAEERGVGAVGEGSVCSGWGGGGGGGLE